MHPLLVHYCLSCTYNTAVPFTASVFSESLFCSHCGAASTGINARPTQEEAANMQQEELARLFSANMSLSQAPPPPYSPPRGPEPQVYEEKPVQHQQQEQEQVAKPITYISQHYTHTHHVLPVRHLLQEPVQTRIEASELEGVFLRNSIDPSLLFPSQVELFKNADDDQRLRLLELWHISPPQGQQEHANSVDYNTSRQLYDWPPTSLAQEEAMAKLRYECTMEQRAQADDIQKHQRQLDQSMVDGSQSAAVQATRNLLTSPLDTPDVEPYIVSGYDMLAQRDYEESAQAAANHLKDSTKYNQATDPVYNHTGGDSGLWEKNVGSMLDMENQYGAYAYARENDVHPADVDDEMMM
ncbi:hypothetical protein BDV95DRAFT_484070 [Massariosphaeria phaeospora]|uniref:Uncharacterized protein n=1 Tax=Massariosphaeria phaeospora TaxID=100035 RepID=A0A7C8IHE3_9PLEO|nr:hypothetical protein BDV95DRAFT_484070 [Massariosphaeria phaeospora]